MMPPVLIAVVWVSIGGVAEDRCRILLERGSETDVVRLSHDELPDLDRTISLAATGGTDREAAAAVLFELVLNHAPVLGIAGPGLLTVEEGGRIHSEAAADRRTRADAGRAATLEADRCHPSRIVAAARTAGLGPEPSAGHEGQWHARCPGTNHNLMLSTSTETFGCGYCRRKGGPQELVAFAARRAGTRRILLSDQPRPNGERTIDDQR